MNDKPYSESCDQNRAPILAVLREALSDRRHVLEIGSGTGQHAVYFGAELPYLRWQTADVRAHHPGIHAWLADAALPNVMPPLALDVNETDWHTGHYDAVFTANTLHIMSAAEVEKCFTGIGQVLVAGGVLVVYGPFNYHGRYTSESNARFDQWLKSRDQASGIRDFEFVSGLARQQGLALAHDHAMPANNRTLVWTKTC